MAKPNYSFEKRQRELAKKKKKEGKLAERAARKSGDGPDEPSAADDVATPGLPAAGSASPDDAPSSPAPAALNPQAAPSAG